MSDLSQIALFDQLLAETVSGSAHNDELCPISGVLLTDKDKITLLCGHTFDLPSLFHEVHRQKKHPAPTETQRLRKHEMKCPMCRAVQQKLIPPHEKCPIMVGVNSPSKYCMFTSVCSHVFKTGQRVGKPCERPCMGDRCQAHRPRTPLPAKLSCAFVITRGPRKGQLCGKRATYSGKKDKCCATHLKSISKSTSCGSGSGSGGDAMHATHTTN